MRVVMVCQEWDGNGPFSVPADSAQEISLLAWGTAAPHVDVHAFAIGDGGPRSADAVAGSRSRVGGVELVAWDATLDGGAVMAAPRGTETRWNPLDLASGLMGLAAEARRGGRRQTVVVPVGNGDCAGDATGLWGVGASLAQNVAAMRSTLDVLDIVVLTTTDRPLLGFHGMSSALRDGRESDAAVSVAAQAQEERWTAIAREIDAEVSRPMLLGANRLSDQAGTGAATGLAYCLAAVGGRLVTDAAGYLMDAVGVTAAIGDDVTVVVALAPTLTPTTLDHGVASSLARTASAAAVPVVAVAPEVHVGKRDLMAAGVAAAYEAGHGENALGDQIRRVAQTWTRLD
ncbi:glycerate kinase [Demequina aurantiaca]|uniref:glycerate kinase n=1 Tax=Demequina aurantiaca TaxID=676200 RepID=UPI000B04FD88|nr:glycerate kinase [Demequina aurantiaca]